MALEDEPEHLPRLPLVPVGAGVHVVDRRHARLVVVEVGFEGYAHAATSRKQTGEYLETGLPTAPPRLAAAFVAVGFRGRVLGGDGPGGRRFVVLLLARSLGRLRRGSL